MKRFMILISLCAGILASFASAQAGTPQQLTDAQLADLVAKVQNMPASKLDKNLPSGRLVDWLQAQGGPGARIAWDFRTTAGTHPPDSMPNYVEAVATLKKDQSFMVSIEVGKDERRPSFHSGWVIIGRNNYIELERLSDLPGAMANLDKANERSSHTEAKNEK